MPVSPSSARASVSACLIVQNEAERLPEALESVAFCDEVIVVDGGSTDGTQRIAADRGARLLENPWPGYARQRNVAIDLATSDWILEVDADERVSPALQAEIQAFLEAPPANIDMGLLPLRDTFIGSTLGLSAKYPRYRNRLFRRTHYRHDERRLVHEGIKARGEVALMEHDLVHILAEDWREVIGDCVRYAGLEARHRPRPGPVELVKGVVFRPTVKFAYRTIALGGWHDGLRGIAWITTECASDALAAALSVRSQVTAPFPEADSAMPTGSVRIIGIAGSHQGSVAGAAWLAEAERAGADVVLVTADPPETEVRVYPLPHFGPLQILRALEVESQVRPVDAVVVHDRAARWLALVPPQRGFPRRISASGKAGTATDVVSQIEQRTRGARTRGAAPA